MYSADSRWKGIKRLAHWAREDIACKHRGHLLIGKWTKT